MGDCTSLKGKDDLGIAWARIQAGFRSRNGYRVIFDVGMGSWEPRKPYSLGRVFWYPLSMVVSGSPKRWDRWHSPSPNWQVFYHLYTTYILAVR